MHVRLSCMHGLYDVCMACVCMYVYIMWACMCVCVRMACLYVYMYGLYVCMACSIYGLCMYGLCVCVVCMCMYELCTCMTCVCVYVCMACVYVCMYGLSVCMANTKATIFYRCNNMSLNHFMSEYRHTEWSNPVAVHSHHNLLRRTHASSSCPSQPKQISIANFVCGNNNQTSKARSRLCKQTNCSTSLNFRLIERSNPQVVLHPRLKKSDEKVCCFAKRPRRTCHQKENMQSILAEHIWRHAFAVYLVCVEVSLTHTAVDKGWWCNWFRLFWCSLQPSLASLLLTSTAALLLFL